MTSRVTKFRLVFLLVILTVAGLLWFEAVSPPQDDFLMENTAANGTSDLRSTALPLNVSLEYLVANVTRDQNITLLLFGPRLSYSGSQIASLNSFVNEGGTLVLADNFGVGNQLLRSLNFPVQFGNATIRDDLFYNSAPAFPIVYDLGPGVVNASVKELVLNNAVPLITPGNTSVTVLARTSPFSYEDLISNGQKDPEEPNGPFPVLVSGRIGRGMIYVFSSPGSFTNSMLSDADNSRLLQFLSGQKSTVLVDQEHLAISSATGVRIGLLTFLGDAAAGTLDQGLKIELVAIIGIAFVFWLSIPVLDARRNVKKTLGPGQTIEQILISHASWNREKLAYVQKEMWKESDPSD